RREVIARAVRPGRIRCQLCERAVVLEDLVIWFAADNVVRRRRTVMESQVRSDAGAAQGPVTLQRIRAGRNIGLLSLDRLSGERAIAVSRHVSVERRVGIGSAQREGKAAEVPARPETLLQIPYDVAAISYYRRARTQREGGRSVQFAICQ